MIGHVEVAREHLQRARDLRDLLHAVLRGRARGHELQVVDDDEAEVGLLRLQPAGLRADLHHRERAGVVDVDRRLGELVAGGRQPRPVLGRELAGPQALRLDLRLAAHEALRHLGLRHLEREERDRRAVAHGQVRAHAEAERGLPHRRAGGEDDEVPRLEARRDAVEVAKAGGDAGDVRARLVERRDPLEALLEELFDVAELGARALLREVEDDLLRLVDELGRIAGPLPAEPRDLAARPDEPAERRRLADDLRVVAGVRARRARAPRARGPAPCRRRARGRPARRARRRA